jgi:hypothetical protein
MLFFMAIPELASTPENENAPAVASEDQQFLDLNILSEEELIEIYVNAIPIDGSGTVVYNPNTGNLINTSNGKVFKPLSDFEILLIYLSLVEGGLTRFRRVNSDNYNSSR